MGLKTPKFIFIPSESEPCPEARPALHHRTIAIQTTTWRENPIIEGQTIGPAFYVAWSKDFTEDLGPLSSGKIFSAKWRYR